MIDYAVLSNVSPQQLRKAADIKERIDALNAELAGILNGGGGFDGDILTSDGTILSRKGKRKMSAAGKARIGAAAKARWAKVRAAKGEAAPKADAAGEAKPKRTMSATGKKKIAAAQKARWAKLKREKA